MTAFDTFHLAGFPVYVRAAYNMDGVRRLNRKAWFISERAFTALKKECRDRFYRTLADARNKELCE